MKSSDIEGNTGPPGAFYFSQTAAMAETRYTTKTTKLTKEYLWQDGKWVKKDGYPNWPFADADMRIDGPLTNPDDVVIPY